MEHPTAAWRGSSASSARVRAVQRLARRAFAARPWRARALGLALSVLAGSLASPPWAQSAALADGALQSVAQSSAAPALRLRTPSVWGGGARDAVLLAQHALELAQLARLAAPLRAQPRDPIETALVLSRSGRNSGALLLELLRQGALPAFGEHRSAALEGARRTALLLSFGLMPREELLRSLDVHAPRAARAGWHECALLVLAHAGLAEDYDLALEIARAPGPDPESVASALREALTALHRRHPASVGRVAARVGHGPLELDAAVLQALGRSDLPKAGPALVRSLGHSPELDALALDELGAWAQRGTRTLDAQDARRVRDELQAAHVATRRAALLALALLDDVASVPQIARQLEAEDAPTRSSAHWALECLTGLRLRNDARSWNAWIAREEAWWQEQGERMLDDLRCGEPGRVARATNALAGRRLLRAECEADLVELLYASSTELVELAAATLSTLGSRQALPALVDLLEDSEERIAQAAWRALRGITGRELPLERELWLAELRSGPLVRQSAEPTSETSARASDRAPGSGGG
jgi:hypothetical protein